MTLPSVKTYRMRYLLLVSQVGQKQADLIALTVGIPTGAEA